MLRKLFPLLLALLGLGAGVGAGLYLRPDKDAAVEVNPCGPAGDVEGQDAESSDEASADHGNKGHGSEDGEASAEYVKLNNQFIVPVVKKGVVEALVILSVSLEVTTGASQEVYAVEPKLRDNFLQVLFDHANAGGFDGAFTASNNMDVLRQALLEVAQQSLGKKMSDVLIVDIVRRQNRLRRLAEFVGYGRLERVRASMEEHVAIIDALLAGDRDWAAALMRQHLAVSRKETEEHFDRDRRALGAATGLSRVA